MAQTLIGLTLVSPSSDPGIGEGQSFTLEASKSFGGGGGINSHDTKAQYSTNDVDWNDITGATPLSTLSTNPQTAQTDSANDTWTIDGDIAGTYYVRVVGDPDGGDDTYSIATSSQLVTINAINNVTLQDLTSIAVSDTPERFKLWPREFGEAVIQLTELTEEERERIRLLLDELATDYSAETRHKRSIELLDSWIGILDSITATTSTAQQGGTFTDTLAVTDALVKEQSLIRETLDTLNALDTAIILRERYPAILDTFGATDALEVLREVGRLTIDTADLSDSTVQLLERNRLLIEAFAAADSIVREITLYRVLQDSLAATDAVVLEQATVVSKTLADLIALTDAVIELRERYRVLADSLAATDAAANYRINRIKAWIGADVTDAALLEFIRDRSVADAFDVTDTQIHEFIRYRLLQESLAATDSIIAISEGITAKTLTDLLAITDTITKRQLLSRTVLDILSVTDSAIVAKVKSLALLDISSVTDLVSQFFSRGRIQTDEITLTESVTATKVVEGILTYYKTVIEALSITDSALGQHVYPLIDFIIKHSVQSLLLEHGIEKFHILTDVKQETSY